MAIPEKLVEFLHGPVFVGIGSRSEKLRPLHTWAMGGIVTSDRQGIVLFVPEAVSRPLMENLKNNGRVAIAAGSPVDNENYQFKGEFLSARPTDEKEVAIQEIYRAKLLASCIQVGYPEPMIKPLVMGFVYKPSLAVTFRIHEIYLQTPGPEAGKRIG